MGRKSTNPWASGPAEILNHALSLLAKDSDINRRICMILIDNAVEQAIKTFLSLPRRVIGISIPRKRLSEVSESFPALLDALEEFAADKLEGVDLGAIEWYHRLRNELYHQGFGLTVEREKVEVYAELAQVLYSNLFGPPTPRPAFAEAERLGSFIELWNKLEEALSTAASYHVIESSRHLMHNMEILRSLEFLTREQVDFIQDLRTIRNRVVHGQPGYKSLLTDDLMKSLDELVDHVEKDMALYNSDE